MKNYIIMADSAADLPLSLIEKYNIPLVGLKCNFKDKEYIEDGGLSLSYNDFYKGIREGEMPTTSQVNTQTYYETFEKYVKEGTSVIYPCFSSALSGSINSAELAKNSIIENYPDADITIIDSKCASLGCGLLIIKAAILRANGESKDSVIKFIETTSPNINHIITLDDLKYLQKGGRLSGTALALGTILQLKPIVKVNENGELINYKKVKGRKKSIQTLFEEFEEKATDIDSQELIAISHSDCLEDVEKLKAMITGKYKIDVLINTIGCVIGSHTGTNTIGLFFIGNGR